MGQILQLEDFATPQPVVAAPQPAVDTSALKKEAFDAGYKDGWSDAFDETRTEEGKARSAIASALQELGFTYFEARQHIMKSFQPLITSMVEAVLPSASSAALIPLVQQEMEALAQMVEPPIHLLCAPSNEHELREMIASSTSLPIEVLVEQTLLPSQVQLHFADGFSSIDADATIGRIRTAIEEFFAQPEGHIDMAQSEGANYA